MADIKDDDLLLIHREGTDYKATVNSLAKDININIDACCEDPNDGKLTIKDSDDNVLGEFTANQDGDTEIVIPAGGGDDLDCDGVADCLVNAPVDKPKYAFAIRAALSDFHSNDQPPHFPEDILGDVHLYCEVCDPDDHHMLELGEEGHGYCAGNRAIFRAPGRFIETDGVYLAICASPPIFVDDRDAIYGAHPDIITVKDLRLWRGNYESGVTTTEDLWTTGVEMPAKIDGGGATTTGGGIGPPEYGFLQDDGHIKCQRLRCDNYGRTCPVNPKEWNENFFRVEFTCHRGDKYQYVFIFSRHDVTWLNTYAAKVQAPDIQIDPMEDN